MIYYDKKPYEKFHGPSFLVCPQWISEIPNYIQGIKPNNYCTSKNIIGYFPFLSQWFPIIQSKGK